MSLEKFFFINCAWCSVTFSIDWVSFVIYGLSLEVNSGGAWLIISSLQSSDRKLFIFSKIVSFSSGIYRISKSAVASEGTTLTNSLVVSIFPTFTVVTHIFSFGTGYAWSNLLRNSFSFHNAFFPSQRSGPGAFSPFTCTFIHSAPLDSFAIWNFVDAVVITNSAFTPWSI